MRCWLRTKLFFTFLFAQCKCWTLWWETNDLKFEIIVNQYYEEKLFVKRFVGTFNWDICLCGRWLCWNGDISLNILPQGSYLHLPCGTGFSSGFIWVFTALEILDLLLHRSSLSTDLCMCVYVCVRRLWGAVRGWGCQGGGGVWGSAHPRRHLTVTPPHCR